MIETSMRGQSLVEVLIAVALGAMLLAVGAALIRPAIQESSQAGIMQEKATLGNELIQNVQAWAAGSWNSVLALSTTSANLYYLNTSSSPFTAVAASSGESIVVGSTTYIRYFYVTDIYRDSGGNPTTTASVNAADPSTKQITVMVNISSSTVSSTTLVGYLTRNQSNIFNQTNWSGGATSTGPVTVVGSQFATSSFLDTSTGALTLLQNALNASYVLGQGDFVSNASNTAQNGMYTPSDVAYDTANGRLFVVDESNNRVLVFNNAAPGNIANGENADYILGQQDFTSRIATSTRNGFHDPFGVAYDSVNQRLFVSDAWNSRVLVFNVATGTIVNGEDADYVLGQTDFGFPSGGVSRNIMDYPMGLAYDSLHNRLFVADYNNSRVMVFNVTPGTIANGENADYVLGQADFTTGTHWGNPAYQNKMNLPSGVAYDSATDRLFVSDTNNERTLAFNVASGTIANGEDADHVLGQANFSSSTYISPITSASMEPAGIAHDPVNQRLFVADDNERVLIFNAATYALTDGEAAGYVIGQPDFVSDSAATTRNGLSNNNGGELNGLAYDP